MITKFLTHADVAATPKTDIWTIRLAEGTNERIDRVLRGGEIRSMFIRVAVEAELQRRESEIKSRRG